MEESDVALVRIIECFLDSCPHKILTLTAIFKADSINPSLAQTLSLTSAFSGFAWSLTAYSRCARLAQSDKRQLSFAGMATQCIWHFCITFSRVVSIVLLASVFPVQTVIGLVVHASAMTLWIFLFDRSPLCSESFFHSLWISMVLGTVFIFTYILPKQTKNSFSRYFFYYSVSEIENLIATGLFFCYSTREMPLLYTLSVLPIISFISGIGAMIIYYCYLHPNILSRRDLMTEL